MSAPLHSSSIDPEGCSQQDIARRLTREGIPTKRGHGPWLQGTVGKLLRSRVPLGERQFKGEWAKANYPAIIDEASWEQAQVLLTANTKAKGGRGGRGRAPRAGHIFSGRDLRCGCCGGAMVPRSVPTQGYYCLTHKRDSTACPMTPRPRPAIDSAVPSYFRQSAPDLES